MHIIYFLFFIPFDVISLDSTSMFESPPKAGQPQTDVETTATPALASPNIFLFDILVAPPCLQRGRDCARLSLNATPHQYSLTT